MGKTESSGEKRVVLAGCRLCGGDMDVWYEDITDAFGVEGVTVKNVEMNDCRSCMYNARVFSQLGKLIDLIEEETGVKLRE